MSVVVITGCSAGFGLEAALAFARNGDTVVATMRDPARGDELRARLLADSLDADIVALDTGCVWGRTLTALCLQTGVLTSVSA